MRYLLSLFLIVAGCTEYNFNKPESDLLLAVDNPQTIPLVLNEDIFLQPTPRPMDFLFAIDRSCSMYDDIHTMNQNIGDFFEVLDDYYIDYRVAVTSTDNSNLDTVGELASWDGQQWVDPYTSDPISSWNKLYMHTWGWGEAGFDAVYGAVWWNYDLNRDFYRDRVPLRIITITDEAEQSRYAELIDMLWVLTRVQAIKGADVDYSVIVQRLHPEGATGDPACYLPDYLTGWEYEVLAALRGGQIIDICSTDWTNVLSEVASFKTERVYQYNLVNTPVEESLEVWVETVDGQHLFIPDQSEAPKYTSELGTWTFDQQANSITLDTYKPQKEDIVKISYYSAATYDSTGER